MIVEVYEWARGATRPRSDRKARHDLIAELEVSDFAKIPARGDVVHLFLANDPDACTSIEFSGTVSFEVMEREWHYRGSIGSALQREPTVWLHVCRITDYTQPTPRSQT